MKKLILLFLMIPTILFSQTYVDVYDGKKVVGKLSIQSLEQLLEASEKYKEILDAQKYGRVYIDLIEPVKKTKVPGQYEAKIKISWRTEINKEVNYIISTFTLNIDNEKEASIPEWRVLYRNISEIGFPISSLLIIILMIIAL